MKRFKDMLDLAGVVRFQKDVTGRNVIFGVDVVSAAAPAADLRNRPPGPFDDSTVGYAVGDQWQSRGAVSSLTYAGPGAVWDNVTTNGVLPGDVVGPTAQFAGGLAQFVSGYTGAAIDISVTISGTPTPSTINILAGGKFDAAALSTAVSRADAGTYVTVTKVYDQRGTNHMVQFGSNSFPNLVWDDLLNSWAISGDTVSSPPQALQFPATVSVTGNNCAYFQFGRAVGTSDGGNAIFGSLGLPASSHMLQMASSSNGGGLRTYSFDGGTRDPAPSPIAACCNPSIVGFNSLASGVQWIVNDDTYTAVADAAVTYTAGLYGGHVGSNYPMMRCVGFVVSNAGLTAARLDTLRRSAYVMLNIAPQVRNNVILVGDSRFAGYNTKYREGIAMALTRMLRYPARVYNFGWASRGAAQAQTFIVPNAIQQYTAGAKNVCVYLLGINDFNNDAVAPAVAYSRIMTNTTSIRAAGFKLILIAELDGNLAAGQRTFLAALRPLLAAGGIALADRIIDLSLHVPSMSADNTAYYSDKLHLTQALSNYIAGVAAQAVDDYLSGSAV